MLAVLGGLICAGCAETRAPHFPGVPPTTPPISGSRPTTLPVTSALSRKGLSPAPALPRPTARPTAVELPVRKEIVKTPPDPVKDLPPIAVVDQNPRLAPGDIIEMKVYQEDDLTSHVRVNADGTVTLPLLGAVRVAGKTADEASEFIRAALEKDYLNNPHVTLSVVEFAKKRFSVMGEVKLPGFYLIPENERINVLQALSMAGGYTAFSRGTRIQVKRIVEGREMVLWVDAKAMAGERNVQPLEVLPGDAITVNSNLF